MLLSATCLPSSVFEIFIFFIINRPPCTYVCKHMWGKKIGTPDFENINFIEKYFRQKLKGVKISIYLDISLILGGIAKVRTRLP